MRGSLLRLNLLALHLSYIVQKLLELILNLQLPHNTNLYFKNTFTLCLFLEALLIYYLLSVVLYLQIGLRIQVQLITCRLPSFQSLRQQGIARESRIRGSSHQNIMLRLAALHQLMKWRVCFCCWATIGNKLFFFRIFCDLFLKSPTSAILMHILTAEFSCKNRPVKNRFIDLYFDCEQGRNTQIREDLFCCCCFSITLCITLQNILCLGFQKPQWYTLQRL